MIECIGRCTKYGSCSGRRRRCRTTAALDCSGVSVRLTVFKQTGDSAAGHSWGVVWIERGEANIRLDTLERLVRGVGWDMAGALSQGPQSLNDGIRTLLRSQLEELGYYLDGVVRWLDALKPDQAPINVTDADIPAPPHLGANPPRRKR